MDGNKDESEKCFSLAMRFLNDGDQEKALKYFLKAQRLYPSEKVKDFIEKLEKTTNGKKDINGEEPQPKCDENARPKTEEAEPSLNHRRNSSATADNGTTNAKSKSGADYTQEQLEAVKKIKRCKDYYEILSLTKEATENDLKKQYRKLALQFHPDKNKAPGASEAFKAIGNAFAVLSDPQKRKQYDLYGKDEPQRTHRHRNNFYSDDGYYYDYSRGFEGDISAEEIFNMFFGGGFPSGSVYVRRNGRFQEAQYRGQNNQQQNEPSGYNVLLQMMPVLVLLCLSLMSSFFVSEPAYSLTRTHKYVFEKKTENLKIPYYVKENFMRENKGSLHRIEADVEEDYLNNLRTNCYRERSYKESLLFKARSYRDHDLEERAKNMKTPSCLQLSELSRKYSAWG